MLDSHLRHQLIERIESLALRAGKTILDAARAGVTQQSKPDGTPVSSADLEADTLINSDLAALEPDWPVITEESWHAETDPCCSGFYWCVDPLDGTRGFLSGSKDYTVNIALLHDNLPLLGVICAPARRMVWCGDGEQAWKRHLGGDLSPEDGDGQPQRISSRPLPSHAPVVVTMMSRRSAMLDEWLDRIAPAEATSVGSSLKFCYLAEGRADLYPRVSPTMEWDTAAGQAILESAGGMVIGAGGERFGYGKPGRRNGYFLATGVVGDKIPADWLPPAESGRR